MSSDESDDADYYCPAGATSVLPQIVDALPCPDKAKTEVTAGGESLRGCGDDLAKHQSTIQNGHDIADAGETSKHDLSPLVVVSPSKRSAHVVSPPDVTPDKMCSARRIAPKSSPVVKSNDDNNHPHKDLKEAKVGGASPSQNGSRLRPKRKNGPSSTGSPDATHKKARGRPKKTGAAPNECADKKNAVVTLPVRLISSAKNEDEPMNREAANFACVRCSHCGRVGGVDNDDLLDALASRRRKLEILLEKCPDGPGKTDDPGKGSSEHFYSPRGRGGDPELVTAEQRIGCHR